KGVAGDAALGLHELTAAVAVAGGRVEVVGGVEIGDDVGHLLAAELRRLDTTLLHLGPHRRAVVPHEAGELREAHVVSATELRADLAALAGDPVARRPLLVPDHRLPPLRTAPAPPPP